MDKKELKFQINNVWVTKLRKQSVIDVLELSSQF